MEPAVQSPRTESAIITDLAQNGGFGLRRLPIFRAAERYWPWKPWPGERNFWMQRREAKNRPERPQVSPETERAELIPAKIPAETASLEPTRRSAVWKDWMVEMVWFELAAPHAVLSNPVSATRLDRCDLAFARAACGSAPRAERAPSAAT
jgi:hypothetical protein